MVIEQIESALNPASIAVVGVSDNSLSMGYNFLRYLIDYGYPNRVYPINRNRKKILNLKAYPALEAVPGFIDYVICCLPASQVTDLLDNCAMKNVKTVHLFTARLSETGHKEAILLEKEILNRARKHGIRLVGPNCMGVYHPGMGISFGYDLPRESGPVGMFIQSGGVSADIIRYASLQGIHFSKVVSYGNGLDLNESDFLEYFGRDPETKIIAGYIEGVKDGRRFFNALQRAACLKPVIILKAGGSSAGAKAAASHTAALAGSRSVWESVIRQARAIQVQTLEELINLVVSLSFLSPISGKKVGIIGGGGGRGVITADGCGEADFHVAPLPSDLLDAIKEMVPEMWWKWIGNPVDISILPRPYLRRSILKLMAGSPAFDFIVANLTLEAPWEKDEFINYVKGEVEDIVEINNQAIKPIVVILPTGNLGINDFENWRWRFIAEQKARLVSARVPVYPTIGQAASALNYFVNYHQKKFAELPH